MVFHNRNFSSTCKFYRTFILSSGDFSSARTFLISKKDSKGKTEDEKAQMSEGEMIWLPHGNNRDHNLNELVDIAKYVDTNKSELMGTPWGDNVSLKINCFKSQLHQMFGGKNGKRKTRNIRRKTRNIRRKSRNIRRNFK